MTRASLFALLILAGCASAPDRAGAPPGPLSACGSRAILAAPGARIDADGEALLLAPVRGCLSSGFGPRRGGAGSHHNGLDLVTGAPQAIAAAADGVVVFAGRQRGYGKTLIIRHRPGVRTLYAHLSEIAGGLKPGARVRGGETIGRTGRTGNATAVHLHYEIRLRGRPVDPLALPRIEARGGSS